MVTVVRQVYAARILIFPCLGEVLSFPWASIARRDSDSGGRYVMIASRPDTVLLTLLRLLCPRDVQHGGRFDPIRRCGYDSVFGNS